MTCLFEIVDCQWWAAGGDYFVDALCSSPANDPSGPVVDCDQSLRCWNHWLHEFLVMLVLVALATYYPASTIMQV